MDKKRLNQMKRPAYPRRKGLSERVQNAEVLLLKLHEGVHELSDEIDLRLRRIESIFGIAKGDDIGQAREFFAVQSLDRNSKYPWELRKMVEGQLLLIDAFENRDAVVEYYNHNKEKLCKD